MSTRSAGRRRTARASRRRPLRRPARRAAGTASGRRRHARVSSGWIVATGAGLVAVLALTLIPLLQVPIATPAAPAAPEDVTAPRAVEVPAGAEDWTVRTAAATGIPVRALRAYAGAAATVAAEQPACGLAWNTLAGIGAIETRHGSHGGAVLRDDGYTEPAIRGIALDGTQSAVIRDTDDGRWDGDAVWDRAVGPMQFIPDTWERWGADGNGDGVADPNQIDDAALSAGRYLCAAGEMSSVEGWRRAILSYNRLEEYVDDVAAMAETYALRASG